MKIAQRHIETEKNEKQNRMETPSNGHNAPSDLQLWQEFKSGSENAFATIYNDNASRLYSYGIKLVHDQDLVKDTIQDLFVELWNTKQRLGEVKSIKSYLYKSIRRALISKASNKRNRLGFFYHLERFEETVPSQEIHLIEKQRFDEERKKLKKALGKLNPKQQEVIHLKFYSRLSYEEIAEVMSLDKKKTYNLVAYTLKLLRQYLSLSVLAFLL
ncbi:RNA polymerase sigma factor [Flagellimonas flava]|uniref:RNA polymerase sigma factor, sigma-70 family n=1 Tax=Flagellimonas flava TaxID=570519 RepID=A0A1M5NL52_9FLAO|nr:sigma-70 family RNA polymerase sigma factor [Allomuricauda flava]SHG90306.1 RNA polymerase sigma factor, sigma-70 family [Allomuricauda flava]